MAACRVCVICFWVLMAGNAVKAFVLKSNDFSGFIGAHSFPLSHVPENLLNGNGNKEVRLGNLETAKESNSPYQEDTDKRVNDLERKVENLLNDNENKEVRLGELETAKKSKSSYLEATDKRVNDLENKFGNLLNDNENKEVRLGELETANENTSSHQVAADRRANVLEKKFENLSHDSENTVVRLGDLEKTVANLASMLNGDCGSPTPLEGTDVDCNSTKIHDIAQYRCKKGFLKLSLGEMVTSYCKEDGLWTKVSLKCANISGCWTVSQGRALYTGTQSTTTSGNTCQRWDAMKPHSHSYATDTVFTIPGFDTPQTLNGSANFCRDPSNGKYLWCYTMNVDERWGKCDVPQCKIEK
ncbi:uncharacterized protein LOC124149673 isoform X2 [Haliotis rufescens]|uniref:uncharacterized protein LOC124149673 isoform X2 n=1 Tax=Haliotis rufescens TaxID=6454 RepID=UPI00201F1F33|nr:uncharacterized protein LOC124149673 isoform X2 [Haliotis rufescens]